MGARVAVNFQRSLGHGLLPLGSAEDADDDLVDQQTGAEEETAVDGAAGDLDEGTKGRDVA